MNSKQRRQPITLSGRISGSNLSDAELVRMAQAGRCAAFDLLMLKYQSTVTKLAMRYVRHAADAEDAAQETFINAYRGLRRFRGDCSFRTWLHRIAINCAKTLLAARARAALVTSLDLRDSDGGPDLPRRLREVETPESVSLSEDIRGMVNMTFDALPEIHRTAIVLREIHCLSYGEIATIMAIPMGTVRSRVFRAREMIDRHLRRVYDGGLGRRVRTRSCAAAVTA